jgi:hypothetical protein
MSCKPDQHLKGDQKTKPTCIICKVVSGMAYSNKNLCIYKTGRFKFIKVVGGWWVDVKEVFGLLTPIKNYRCVLTSSRGIVLTLNSTHPNSPLPISRLSY